MENKVRVSMTKEIILVSTESTKRVPQINFGPGEETRLTAREIFKQMSVDPVSMMPYNPTASSLSNEEKTALDELFSLIKDAATNLDNITVAENCLQILSSPFGLLHPRREESIDILKKATKMPKMASFADSLIAGSKKMLNDALSNIYTDEGTRHVARDLLEKIE